MESFVTALTWLTLLLAPGLFFTTPFNLRGRSGSIDRGLFFGAVAIVGIVLSMALAGLETPWPLANIGCCLVAYLAWCALTSAISTVRHRARRIVLKLIAWASFVPGWLACTLGVLSLPYMVDDYLRPPLSRVEMAPGLSCITTYWEGFSDAGHTVHVYRYLPWFPLLRREVASEPFDEIDPVPGQPDPTCKSVARIGTDP